MKKNDINNTLKEINELSKLLKESYVFDEEDDLLDNEYDDVDEFDYTDETNESEPINANEKINQIRSLALEGIQEFSDDVNSEEYDFFKKIWLMCDKVFSEKDNNNNKEE